MDRCKKHAKSSKANKDFEQNNLKALSNEQSDIITISDHTLFPNTRHLQKLFWE